MPLSAGASLWTTRGAWLALLLTYPGLAAVLLLANPPVGSLGEQTGLLGFTWVIAATLLMLVLGLMMGYYMRGQAYKMFWRRDQIRPLGYLLGNLMLFIGLTVGGAGALVGLAVTGAWGFALLAAAPLVLHVLNFPHGKPMQPHPPRFT